MARYFITGDKIKGATYIPQALHAITQLRAAGIKTGNRTVFLAEGVLARITLHPVAGDVVYIEVETGPVIPISGFLDTYGKIQFNTDTGLPQYANEVSDQMAKEKRLAPIPPSAIITPEFYGVRTVAHPDVITTTTLLPIEPNTPAPPPIYPDNNAVPFREMFKKFLPSRFTGHMRKVMQCALSARLWKTPAGVQVDYKYGNCFGVIKHANKYFMLKITASEVFYIPAIFYVSTKKGIGVNPVLSGDVPQLVECFPEKARKIGTFSPVGDSWSAEIGWAFSYGGAEASIVLTSGISTPTGNVYCGVSLAKISFLFDINTGEPSGIAFNQSEPKIFWNHNFMGGTPGDFGLFNIPKEYPSTSPLFPNPILQNTSINFGPSRPPFTGPNQKPPGYEAKNIPVYVFYSESKGQQLCTYSYSSTAGWVDTKANPGTTVVGVNYMQMPGPTEQTFNYTDSSALIDQGWTGSKTYAGTITYGFSCGAVHPPTPIERVEHNTTVYKCGSEYVQASLFQNYFYRWQYKYAYGAIIGYVWGQWYGAGKHPTMMDLLVSAHTETGGGTTVESSCTLPIGDREAVLLCSLSTAADKITSDAYTMQNVSVIDGASGWWHADAYDATPIPSEYTTEDGYAAGRSGSERVNSALCDSDYFIVSSSQAAKPTLFSGRILAISTPPTYNNLWDFTTATRDIVYCGGFPSETIAPLYTRTPFSSPLNVPPANRSITVPGGTEYKLTLVTGGGEVEIDPTYYRASIFNVHPVVSALSYGCTTAAFNPHNIAYQTGHDTLVQFGGTSYHVEHELYGWIGVV